MRTPMRAAALLVTTVAIVWLDTAKPVAQNERPNPQATRQTPPPTPQTPTVYRVESETRDVAAAKRDQQKAFTCTVPDSDARFNVDSVMTYRGQSYRCVEVYVPNKPSQGPATLQFSAMGWIKERGAPGK